MGHKKIKSYNVEGDFADRFCALFGGKCSQMVNDFIKSQVLRSESPIMIFQRLSLERKETLNKIDALYLALNKIDEASISLLGCPLDDYKPPQPEIKNRENAIQFLTIRYQTLPERAEWPLSRWIATYGNALRQDYGITQPDAIQAVISEMLEQMNGRNGP